MGPQSDLDALKEEVSELQETMVHGKNVRDEAHVTKRIYNTMCVIALSLVLLSQRLKAMAFVPTLTRTKQEN